MTALEDARELRARAIAARESRQKAGITHESIQVPIDVVLALTTPPTDDEREALATVIESARLPMGGTLLGSRPQFIAVADAILASDVWRNRRQGPITDTMIQRAREASAAQFGYYPTIEEATVILEAARDAS